MTVITPGSTIGIIGGGQLGRMLSHAATRMGYRTHIFTPEADSPAAEVSCHTTVAAYDDEAALAAFARSVDVVTFEFENIPHASLALLESIRPVHPSAKVLELSQNRNREKPFIRSLDIGTAPFHPVRNAEDVTEALRVIGVPSILKTAEMGYDGKGQAKVERASDAVSAWEAFGRAESVLEGFVDFRMEISVIVARNAMGEVKAYPPVQNIHKHHILDTTIAPAPISDGLASEANGIAVRIADALGLVGLMAVEMFVTRDERLLVNELAPRPHNSGHWSMDACVTSQFEQAVRAVCGLPLGAVDMLCPAEMKNLIGDDIDEWHRYASDAHSKLHLYGKKEARAGRKMGHVTRLKP